jgi:hypothetical protein
MSPARVAQEVAVAGLLRLGLPLSSWLFSSDAQKRVARIIATL